jgi:hypothetical protein
MNPGPILIIRNTFPTLARVFLISSLIKSKNTKHIYFLAIISKTPLPYCISRIIALVYFIASYLFYCICYFILLTFNTLCLTTIRWSWGCNTRSLFCRLPDENEERFFECYPRVRYKPWVSSWGKFTLATTLCTWSPNEVAHCLVSSESYGVLTPHGMHLVTKLLGVKLSWVTLVANLLKG